MVRNFQKNRPRLLIISKNSEVRHDLVTLLTGYGYYVDYVDNREDGIHNYREHKHHIVIMDVASLPSDPERMFSLFQAYKKNPVILVAAHKQQEYMVYPYMQQGVYDIVQLPLKIHYLRFILRRLVEHSRMEAKNEFMRSFLKLLFFISPAWLTLIFILL
ncbi:MAG: hypothetical protein ACOC4C_03095 [Fibrobacterota bacterium]